MFKHLTFLFLLLMGCAVSDRDHLVKIVWKDNKAAEIELTNPSLAKLSVEKLSSALRVELGDSGEPMLGQFFRRNGRVVFQPVVPFTRGMHYHVLANDIIFSEFDIPEDELAKSPTLTLYPSTDTLPENTLKMYLQFSEPMVEGKSMRHIHMLEENGDTLKGTFLDLQPELWNADGTMLTLWFDPGRVKRDLIPNQKMGNPIQKNKSYVLSIDGGWKSKSGKELGVTLTKKFIVQDRDELSPDVNDWKLSVPEAQSNSPLIVDFIEVLDFSLIQSVIKVLDKEGKPVKGTYLVLENERGINFIPDVKWQRGRYTIGVESRLEDLAGNNLNRLFDRDLTVEKSVTEEKYFNRVFEIR